MLLSEIDESVTSFFYCHPYFCLFWI